MQYAKVPLSPQHKLSRMILPAANGLLQICECVENGYVAKVSPWIGFFVADVERI
jgi:hypothetical protein